MVKINLSFELHIYDEELAQKMLQKFKTNLDEAVSEEVHTNREQDTLIQLLPKEVRELPVVVNEITLNHNNTSRGGAGIDGTLNVAVIGLKNL